MNNYTIEIDDMFDYFDWYNWKDTADASDALRGVSRMKEVGWTDFDYKTLLF